MKACHLTHKSTCNSPAHVKHRTKQEMAVQLPRKQGLAIKRLSGVHTLTRYSDPIKSWEIRGRSWKLRVTVTKVMLHHATLASTGITAHTKPEWRCPAKMCSYNPCVQMGKWYLLEDHLCLGNQIALKKHTNKSPLGKLQHVKYLFVCLLLFPMSVG